MWETVVFKDRRERVIPDIVSPLALWNARARGSLKSECVDVEQSYVLTPITHEHKGRPVKRRTVFLAGNHGESRFAHRC